MRGNQNSTQEKKQKKNLEVLWLILPKEAKIVFHWIWNVAHGQNEATPNRNSAHIKAFTQNII